MKHDMSILSRFAVPKDGESVRDLLNNVWYVHTVERYTAVETGVPYEPTGKSVRL